MRNSVFIATSLDGFIAGKNGDISFLDYFPAPEGSDMGYFDFISQMDAIVMGRNSFEKVLSFGIDWPYKIPVFVLSNTLSSIPKGYEDKIELIKGSVDKILIHIHSKGFKNLYVDGGITIQNFLREDLIDDMVITIVPVLLGEGISLFSSLPDELRFECTGTVLYSNRFVQNKFKRTREN